MDTSQVAQQATKTLGLLIHNKESKVKANQLVTKGSAKERMLLHRKAKLEPKEPLFAAGARSNNIAVAGKSQSCMVCSRAAH